MINAMASPSQQLARFRAWLHHVRLLWQWWLVKDDRRGAHAVVRGERLALPVLKAPRYGERLWVIRLRGQVDSSEIEAIDDTGNLMGYD